MGATKEGHRLDFERTSLLLFKKIFFFSRKILKTQRRPPRAARCSEGGWQPCLWRHTERQDKQSPCKVQMGPGLVVLNKWLCLPRILQLPQFGPVGEEGEVKMS